MQELHGLHVWLARDGFFDGHIDAPTTAMTLDELKAAAAANGQTVIEMGPDRQATRPPDRPLTAAQRATVDKRAQLDALRAKGWVNLSDAEKTEARGLAFDLGQYAPG
ncbi:MAG: hypothetical protein KGK34_07215 [Chloroflexota bacterium]|nr:hypothetical protein [Chloroflexota bacterium]